MRRKRALAARCRDGAKSFGRAPRNVCEPWRSRAGERRSVSSPRPQCTTAGGLDLEQQDGGVFGHHAEHSREFCARNGSLLMFRTLHQGTGVWLADVAGGDVPRTWDELARAWSLDPLLLCLVGLTAWGYLRGSRQLSRYVRPGWGLRPWEQVCFWLGWVSVVIALISPLHAWGQVLFTAHMTQHELLMVIAAPLLVLGRPVVALLFALRRADARQLASMFRQSWLARLWHVLAQPLVAWILHAAALWVWHVPPFYEATLRNEILHHLQHVCFFGTALLFWWTLVHTRTGRRHYGVATLYVFTTMIHSGLLGALITFAHTLLYPSYAATAPDWSLTPLEDQQLGGAVMWVPAGTVYLLAGLALIAVWMRALERRAPAAPASRRQVAPAP